MMSNLSTGRNDMRNMLIINFKVIDSISATMCRFNDYCIFNHRRGKEHEGRLVRENSWYLLGFGYD